MGIIFDLDGTLIDSLSFHAETMKIAMDRVLGKDVVSYAFIRSNIRYPSSILFSNLNLISKRPISDRDINKIMQNKERVMSKRKIKGIKIFKGVTEVIEILKRNQIKYCVATSMNSRELRKIVPALGLSKISHIIVNSPSLNYEKPNPYIINQSVKIYHMKKSRTFYIGDSPYDRIASRRAGVKFIGIFNKKELGSNSLFCKDIPDLTNRIERNMDKFRD